MCLGFTNGPSLIRDLCLAKTLKSRRFQSRQTRLVEGLPVSKTKQEQNACTSFLCPPCWWSSTTRAMKLLTHGVSLSRAPSLSNVWLENSWSCFKLLQMPPFWWSHPLTLNVGAASQHAQRTPRVPRVRQWPCYIIIWSVNANLPPRGKLLGSREEIAATLLQTLIWDLCVYEVI